MEQVLECYEKHRGVFLERFKELLRISSISAQPEHEGDMRQAAELVRRYLVEAGLSAEVLDTGGHPAVVADSGPAEGAGPAILIYGHYDVQPEGDLDLWHTPPFEPSLRDGVVFARGAADDKGQLLTHIFAAQCWREATGSLPIRVKFLIEGEEEVASPNLGGFIRANQERLACDYVVISDTAQFGEERPALTYGTKGMVYKEIFLRGPKQNIHSGSFGGTIANPANVLAHIISSLYGPDGQVAIPGFYDDVEAIQDEESARFASLPFDENAYLEELGSPALFGEPGFSTLERRWVRPTLDVNGIVGGYIGQGASTVIPAVASAKISMRLVPSQDPQKISAAFNEAVRAACPNTVSLEIVDHGAVAAYLAPLESPAMKAAAAAIRRGFGVESVLIREGGSLPILPMFKEVLGADSILMGFCQPTCNAHGPNEFLHVRDFEAGIRSAVHMLGLLAG